MKILLDLDDVLADFVSTACRRVNRQYPYDNACNHGEWNLPPLVGMTTEDFWRQFDDADWWSNLPWCEHGRTILDLAFGLVGFQNVSIVTRPCPKFFQSVNRAGIEGISPSCAEGKIRWVQREISPACRITLTTDKSRMGDPCDVLIDDCDANVQGRLAAGYSAILVPRPWNSLHAQTHDDLAVVRDALTEWILLNDDTTEEYADD